MDDSNHPRTGAASVTDVSAASVTDGIGVLGIDHVGIAVPDLDAAIEFYARVFGLRCVHRETNDEQGVREAMLVAGGWSGAAEPSGTGDRSRAAGSYPTGTTMIQLLAPARPDSPIGKFLDRSGPGVQQLAYTVADVDAACAALRERGVRLLYPAPRPGTAGSRINFTHPKDTGGVLVELVQRAVVRAPAPANPTDQ